MFICSTYSGAPFHVTTIKSPTSTPESPPSMSTLNDEIPKLYYSKLTPDQRFLIFHEHDDATEVGDSLEPLEISKIHDLQTIMDEKMTYAVCLRVKSNSEELSIKLDSPPEPSRKPSIQWLSALIQVMMHSFLRRQSRLWNLTNLEIRSNIVKYLRPIFVV